MLLWQMLCIPWICQTYRTQMLYTTCGSQRRSKKEKTKATLKRHRKKNPLALVWCFKFVYSFSWIAFCIVLRVVFVNSGTFFQVRSMLFLHTYNRLYDCSFTRHASVDHTCLRLGSCCLREYLFKINSGVSPICECSFDSELVKHFFLYCPGYAT